MLHPNSCSVSEKSVRSTVLLKGLWRWLVLKREERTCEVVKNESAVFYPFQNPESASLITRPKRFEGENDAGERGGYRFPH